MRRRLNALVLFVGLLLVTGVFGIISVAARAPVKQNSFPHQNPDTRKEILYSHNDGTVQFDTLWSIMPDGSANTQILARDGFSIVEGKVSDDGKYLAVMECGSFFAGKCEFDIFTYPDLKTNVATGTALRRGGISWKRNENSLFTLEWVSGKFQETVVLSSDSATTAMVKDAPEGWRPIVDNTGFWAYETSEGVMVEDTLIPYMQYPTVGAADSVVVGTCGGYLCSFESIKPNVPAIVSGIKMEQPEMAFSSSDLTSTVYVSAGDIFLMEDTSGKTICLTCVG